MPQRVNVEKRLSKMVAKQESLSSELQSLAETHGGDGEGEARTILMTWTSSLEALENAREALDDLVVTVPYLRCGKSRRTVRRRLADAAPASSSG